MRKLWTATLLFYITRSSVSLSKGQEPSSIARLAEATDLGVPAGAIELRLQRKHVANRSAGGPLGSRWRHNWECRLSRTAGEIRIEDWSGVSSFDQGLRMVRNTQIPPASESLSTAMAKRRGGPKAAG